METSFKAGYKTCHRTGRQDRIGGDAPNTGESVVERFSELLFASGCHYTIDTSGSYRMCILSQIAKHFSVSGPRVLHALQDNVTGAYSQESRNTAYINTSHASTRT